MYLRLINNLAQTVQGQLDTLFNAHQGTGSVDVKMGTMFGTAVKVAADTWRYSRGDWSVDFVVSGNSVYVRENLGGTQIQGVQNTVASVSSASGHMSIVTGDDYIAFMGGQNINSLIPSLAVRLPVDPQYGVDTSAVAMFANLTEVASKQYQTTGGATPVTAIGFANLGPAFPTLNGSYYNKSAAGLVAPARPHILATSHGAVKVLDWLRQLGTASIPGELALVDNIQHVAYNVAGSFIRID